MILDPKEITIVGETNFRSMRKKFGIKLDDRRRHMYIIGKSGSGKSVLLENMIIQDIRNGKGCCVMDPHGDLAEKIINFIPNERINDVVYVNPSDLDYPIAFNILEGAKTDSSKNLVTSGLIGIFKKMWADSWGPRLEYVLRNAILTLMYDETTTLLSINRILIDKNYRDKVLEKVEDPIVKAFWTQEYETYPAKELPMIISPIQNKVGQFLSNSLVRNILGQIKSTIDLRDIMDNNKILLVNLSKGRIGEDNSSLIGSMLVTKLYLAAMSRVDLPEDQRKDFYLYVDEFQNFATDSFADILSEARKYRLNLIMAHQYVTQLPEKVADAIFGNGGTLITFRLGPQDAEIFEKEFAPDFVLEDLVNIPKWNVVLKLLIDGIASKPFSAATLAPIPADDNYKNRAETIIKISRSKYARKREEVEATIKEWTLSESNGNSKRIEPKKEEKKKDEPKKEDLNSTNCWVCGLKMDVPFKPDGKRPIYCTDCLKKIRENLIPEPKNNRFKVNEGKEQNNNKIEIKKDFNNIQKPLEKKVVQNENILEQKIVKQNIINEKPKENIQNRSLEDRKDDLHNVYEKNKNLNPQNKNEKVEVKQVINKVFESKKQESKKPLIIQTQIQEKALVKDPIIQKQEEIRDLKVKVIESQQSIKIEPQKQNVVDNSIAPEKIENSKDESDIDLKSFVLNMAKEIRPNTQHSGDRKQETVQSTQETGISTQESVFRRQETGDRAQEVAKNNIQNTGEKKENKEEKAKFLSLTDLKQMTEKRGLELNIKNEQTKNKELQEKVKNMGIEELVPVNLDSLVKEQNSDKIKEDLTLNFNNLNTQTNSNKPNVLKAGEVVKL